MKIRMGFVSNSSSTSFIIRNISNKTLSLYDFAKETSYLVADFVQEYDWYQNDPSYTEDAFLDDAKRRLSKTKLKPGKSIIMEFGDEDGDLVGKIYDYMLRNGGETKNFYWEYNESLR